MVLHSNCDTDGIPSKGEPGIADSPSANFPLNALRSSDDVDEFMDAIQNTLLFRVEWQTLLAPGPKSLLHMGECFIAAASIQIFPLFPAANSVPGLPYTSLISNLLSVSDSGVEAFNTAKRRMNELFEISCNINRHLYNIVECVRALPDEGSLRRLRIKLEDFRDDATEATACAKKAHMAFADWKSLITALRRAILDKQNTVPNPPAVQPKLPIPAIPILLAPPANIANTVASARVDDPAWAELPAIDAIIRRFYGVITYTVEGVSFPGNLYTVQGQQYILRLQQQAHGQKIRLATSLTTDIAHTCGLFSIIEILTGNIFRPTTAIWQPCLLELWGKTSAMIRQAKILGRISSDSNTWDITDMVDLEYYKRSGIATSPTGPIPPASTPATSPDLDSLVRCTDGLGKVKREIDQVIRFFDAVSVLGQTIVSVHVRDFTRAGADIVRTGQVGEQARSDFVKHALSVKTYFSVICAVASMYNHIHPTYVAEGLDLLTELSLSSTGEVRVLRQRSLANYSRTVAVDLAEYIERKKRTILRQIRGEVDEIVA